jgi:hypothetical protein
MGQPSALYEQKRAPYRGHEHLPARDCRSIRRPALLSVLVAFQPGSAGPGYGPYHAFPRPEEDNE